jgi:hypothetical protein
MEQEKIPGSESGNGNEAEAIKKKGFTVIDTIEIGNEPKDFEGIRDALKKKGVLLSSNTEMYLTENPIIFQDEKEEIDILEMTLTNLGFDTSLSASINYKEIKKCALELGLNEITFESFFKFIIKQRDLQGKMFRAQIANEDVSLTFSDVPEHSIVHFDYKEDKKTINYKGGMMISLADEYEDEVRYSKGQTFLLSRKHEK